MALQGEPGGRRAPRSSWCRRRGSRALVSVGRRAEGAKPVGLCAHPLLPPQTRGDQLVRPARVRPDRHLRRSGGAIRLRRARSAQHHLAPDARRQALFGTDLLGRDYLSRVIFGMRTSLWVAFTVAFLSTMIGTSIGALAGYFGGAIDNLLMRFTDLILTLPGLAVLLDSAAFLGRASRSRSRSSWPSSSGRELHGSCAASSSRSGRRSTSRRPRRAGAATFASSSGTCSRTRSARSSSTRRSSSPPPSWSRRRSRSSASASSRPHPALGKLIDDGQGEGSRLWWLVTFPGLTIVLIALAINFVGDGLRDALDPTQRRVRA